MTTEVSKASEQFTKIGDILKSKKDAIQSVLPQHLTSERLTTIFMSACRKNPKLLNCTAGSLVKAFMDAGEIGLEPDGTNAHLIPYGTECTYMVDYKGYIRLARLSDEVSDMTANVVYSNDKFEHEYGSDKHLKHVKTLSKDRGIRVAAYSYVKYKDGSEDFRVLTEAEVLNAKKSSKSENIWKDHTDQMWAKTAVRQHAKFLPRHKELQKAALADERLDLKDIDISDITEIATEKKTEILKEKLAAKTLEKAPMPTPTPVNKVETTKKDDKPKPPEAVDTVTGEVHMTFKERIEELARVVQLSDKGLQAEIESLGFEKLEDVPEKDQKMVEDYLKEFQENEKSISINEN